MQEQGWSRDEAGGGSTGVKNHRMGIAEFLMLDAMAPLATGSARMWRPLSTALAACRYTGRAATQALAERWECPPAELDSLCLHLQSVGLQASADALSRSVCPFRLPLPITLADCPCRMPLPSASGSFSHCIDPVRRPGGAHAYVAHATLDISLRGLCRQSWQAVGCRCWGIEGLASQQ